MQPFIVSGSHLLKSQSGRIALYLKERCGASGLGLANIAPLLDLGKNPLPMWDEGVWSETEKWKTQWHPWLAQLREADSFIVVCPEWGGMVTPALKNFLLLASGTGALAHKPGLIVTVSASRGGAYPVTELRSSGYKNTYLCYIPEHIIVRNAESMLLDKSATEEDDIYLRARIDYSLNLLDAYAQALLQLREKGLIDLKTYPYGM